MWNAPVWLTGALVDGVYRVLAWVVSVMLPPMAIFFPLFTLLEDSGYLPRVAFNLDRGFQKCSACGKQALTMCMGFGCNAAGVTGCRIIDSPRERLIAIITNNFVPCNGRLPTPRERKHSLTVRDNRAFQAACLERSVVLGLLKVNRSGGGCDVPGRIPVQAAQRKNDQRGPYETISSKIGRGKMFMKDSQRDQQ